MKVEEILEKILPALIIGGAIVFIISRIKPGVGAPAGKVEIGEIEVS